MSTRTYTEKEGKVKYGAKIKLRHVETGKRLHSHALNHFHQGTSGQQQVSCFAGSNDDDFWVVKVGHGKSTKKGKVQLGDVIRIEHVATKRNLHSHPGILSPTTKQQEVTAFGINGEGDTNDNWIVEAFSSKSERGVWGSQLIVRLRHESTSACLHSHPYNFPLGNGDQQQEVTGFTGSDNNDKWVIDDLQVQKKGTSTKKVSLNSQITIKHSATGKHLHSHNLNYTHPATSGQQQVTCFGGSDVNDKWYVHAPHGKKTKAGKKVHYGKKIRLEHVQTHRNLHSHAGIQSPATQQQEVTAFGKNGEGDSNDDWVVEAWDSKKEKKDSKWKVGEVIRLRHVNTGMCLHSHALNFPIGNGDQQQEVTGFGGNDSNDKWQVDNLSG